MYSAVVTGAASGIGAALARAAARRGASVVLADVASLDLVARATGGLALSIDVSDPAQMLELAERASDARLVCLNAGIVGAQLGAPWEASDEEWRRLLEVNLLGVVNGLRAFVPRLLASGEPAQILITASLAGLVAFPTGGAYGATKHAVVGLAEQASLALDETPVSVSVLCPSLVRSGMSEVGADPDELATLALEAVDAGRFVIMPPEWAAPVRERAARLAGGLPPSFPRPR